MASGQAPEHVETAEEPAVAADPVVFDGGLALPFLGGGMGAGMGLGGIRRLPPRQRAAALARLSAGTGNAALARLIQRELPAGGAPVPAADPEAGAEALRLNGMAMDELLTSLDAKGRLWVTTNQDALVHTPGVGPQRMALAVEAVLAGTNASDERLAAMMGEMQAMGLPDDQQEAVAKFCGAFGLRAPALIDQYVKGAAALKDRWPTMSADERARKLGELAGAELVTAGVPAPKRVDVEPLAEGGLWDRTQWRIVVASRIGSIKDDADKFARAAATIYHEARHGEQDFLVLRMLAGRGKGAGEILLTYDAPPDIVLQALSQPLPPQDQRAERATEWLASSKAPVKYEDRPEERDAHGAGNTVADRVRGGTPPDRSSQLRDPWIPTVGGQTGAPPGVARRALQRQDSSGGPPAPAAPAPPAPASDARKKIDDALSDFSQGAFRDVSDWSLATSDEKLRLLDKATALDLFWVGPRDEAAIERCWASFGASFESAAELNPTLWTRSVKRGADPENIPQTKGRYPALKDDILSFVRGNLDKNEDRVVAEMGEFGLPPPYDLLRAGNPAAKGFGGDAPAPVLGGPTPSDRLKEQSRLAKLLIAYKKWLKDLGEIRVGIDLRKFSPGNRPFDWQDIVLWNNLTSWDLVHQTWQRVATEIALIENAWPALYAADLQGVLENYAGQTFDEKDPLKAGQNTNAQLDQVKQTFRNTLTNIKSMRDKVADGSADAIDFTPVQRALWAGAKSKSGQSWKRNVWLPLLNDEREVRDDVAAAEKFAVDVGVMIVMATGPIGTLAGAAIAIGAAGITTLGAEGKAETLTAAQGAAVSDTTTLVTKQAVSAAQAEAKQAELEFGVTVVTSVLAAGVAAAHLNTGQLEKAMPKLSAEGGTPETQAEIDKLRDQLNAQKAGGGGGGGGGSGGPPTTEPGSTQPGSTQPRTGTTTTQPGTTTAQPGTTTAEPGTTTSEPGTTTAEPGTTTARPGTTTVTAPPGGTTAQPAPTAAPGGARPPQTYRAVDSNLYEPLGEPDRGTSDATILREKATGRRFLFKPAAGEKPVTRAQQQGIQQGTYNIRGAAASQVAPQMGIEAPPVDLVEYDGKVGSMQPWFEGMRPLADLPPDEATALKATQEYKNLRSNIDTFDYLMNNLDRNEGNLLVGSKPDGSLRLVAIDNELVFPKSAQRLVMPGWAEPMPEFFTPEMEAHLNDMSARRGLLRSVLTPFLTDVEVDGVFKRLDQILAEMQARRTGGP